MTPSANSLKRIKGKVKFALSFKEKTPAQIVKELNPILRG